MHIYSLAYDLEYLQERTPSWKPEKSFAHVPKRRETVFAPLTATIITLAFHAVLPPSF